MLRTPRPRPANAPLSGARGSVFLVAGLALAGFAGLRIVRAEAEPQEGDGAPKADERPNILLIVADDLKPNVVGFEGDPVVRTPHLDRLAREGTTFARAYVPLPQCGPSRAALLVGRYPHETGSTTNPGSWNPEHPTLASLLEEQGYRTGLIGKWHLGNDDEPQAGFSSWCTISRDFQSYQDPVLWVDGERREFRGFLPDVLTDLAIEFVDGRRLVPARDDEAGDRVARPSDAPFFLWLAYKTPHEPWTMPVGERFEYPRKDMPVPASMSDDLSTKPKAQRESDCHAAYGRFKTRTLKLALVTYYAMITSLDENIGRLVEHLESRDRERETLVVFLSDNGYLTGEHQMFTKGAAFYEEMVRTPLVFHWPGHVPAGARRQGLASTMDLLPTFVRVAGGTPPEGIAGADLMPLVRGEVERVHDELFFEYERKLDDHVPMLGVVTPEAKYVRYLETNEEELYRLADDPLELTNLAGSAEQAELLARLRERVDAFQRGIEVPFW